MSTISKQSRGGRARAEKLDENERREIARRAAVVKWEKAKLSEPMPKATHKGELTIGGASLPCAVLEDGRRIITETGVTTALGSRSEDRSGQRRQLQNKV